MLFGFYLRKAFGTIQSAFQGREALGTAAGKVIIIDSNSTSMAMGLQILIAARAAEQGASLKDCVRLVEEARKTMSAFILPSIPRNSRTAEGASVRLNVSLAPRLT